MNWPGPTKVKELLIKNKSPNVAFVSESDTMDALARIEQKDNPFICNLTSIEIRDFWPRKVGWMYPYDSSIQPMFDKFMLHLYESGTIRRIEYSLLTKKPCLASNEYQEISFEFVKILFVILSIGLVAAIFIGVCEKIKICIRQHKYSTKTEAMDLPTNLEHEN